jgi:2-polyprenyl-3-methyl-5-hydroxy-6-metoxy-1,4-benzoquinol methylase
MGSITDDRGFNQGFKPSRTLEIRNNRRFSYVLDKLDPQKKADILEIGCGLGDLSFYLAQHSGNNVVGTDLCKPFIAEAKATFNLPNLTFQTLDFNNPEQLFGKTFDYIVGNGILHHLYYELDDAFLNLRKLLKKGGKIIFLEPNLLNPYCYLIFNTTGFFRRKAKLEPSEKAFTKRFIHKKLESSGFKNIVVEYKDFLVPPTPFILIKPTIILGDFLEKVPVLKSVSQSLFISADFE